MKKALFILPALMLTIATSAQSPDNGPVPQAVTRDFASRYPAITPKKWKQDKEGQYIAQFHMRGNPSEAYYDRGGNWLKTQSHIKWTKNLPPAVRTALRNSTYASWYVEHMQETDSDDHKRFYIDVSYVDNYMEGAGSKDIYRLTFTPEGQLLQSEQIH
ncbi:MAG TPA: hypothetical protein VHE34_00520 [Puia sp.]|uniref:hypothetical protein n=1 Tax=Puia sp. TaxID=2045100 RepID=UPI002C4B4DDB|nr:hypothetical protein [Puia sp.]HVU93668.1 hypothetical protein [Puia sp.]